MVISSLKDEEQEIAYEHKNDQLILSNLNAKNGKEIDLIIQFSGIPMDGLVIGENKYGNRTFFGDNWPNRAHNWFVCVDHPSDKATIDYTVFVPPHYEVIANGEFVQMSIIREDLHRYKYSSSVVLPTKVMVIGVADFESKDLDSDSEVSISSWVYPENKNKAFYDFDLAPQILEFFVNYIGPYEYEKLANVQSTTRYGGMENAGCIFYDEHSINGKRTSETLIAHEIAHQWFGNSVSEKDWMHIWLSEGFATYFTNLYIEKNYGVEAFQKQLAKDRKQVIDFYKKYPNPIVDSNYVNLIDLLNPNSYQKGAWVLHMLRRKIGDEHFKSGIIAFYQKYRLSNADSEDFIRIMEEISGSDLTDFFQQWIYSSGHPIIKSEAKIKKKEISITITQTQSNETFSFPLVLEMTLKSGEVILNKVEITEANHTFQFKTPGKVKSWKIDPFVDLLFQNAI
jgi:aminopeptidase N